MEAIKKIRSASGDSWIATLASLVPFWLLSVAILVEGFPKPPISLPLAVTAFVIAIAIACILLRRGWLEIDILLHSLFPFILMFKFDEISTAYKSPFILISVLILSVGIVGAQRTSRSLDSVTVRWLILLFVAVATWVVASHAVQSYWQMVGDLGYGAFPLECMPDTQDCPLTGDVTPWWVLFFRP